MRTVGIFFPPIILSHQKRPLVATFHCTATAFCFHAEQKTGLSFDPLPCLDLACNRLTGTQCSLMYPVQVSYGIPGKSFFEIMEICIPKKQLPSWNWLSATRKRNSLFRSFKLAFITTAISIMQREHSLNQLNHVESKIRNVSQDHEVLQSGLSMVLCWVIIGVFTVSKGLSSHYQHHPHSLPKLYGLLQ